MESAIKSHSKMNIRFLNDHFTVINLYIPIDRGFHLTVSPATVEI
ncbi:MULTISPECIES: hypothetical protein [unclassified Alteromonas]|nr:MULTISPECIES: hypothetical protein [unclassified Alteromonas]